MEAEGPIVQRVWAYESHRNLKKNTGKKKKKESVTIRKS